MRREDAVGVLLERVPSFTEARSRDVTYISHDDDSLPYMVFADFARFLREVIIYKPNEQGTPQILAQSFLLLGEIATSPDPELADLAVVGVFETLADSPDCTAVARKLLSRKARKVLDRVVRGWI